MTMPAFVKPRQVIGHHLVLRDATPADAEFIVALRTDESKSRFISKTSSDVSQQVAWLEKYAQDNSQVYFIMEDREHNPVGTVRLYDQQGDSFCWGSWVIREGSPSGYAVESALMVYQFALSLASPVRILTCARAMNRCGNSTSVLARCVPKKPSWIIFIRSVARPSTNRWPSTPNSCLAAFR